MKKILLLTLLFLLFSNNAKAASFTNGSFENGMTGWSLSGGGIDLISGWWEASDGNYSIDLNRYSKGGIFQEFDTTPGQKYKVLFDIAGNVDNYPLIKEMQVSAAGQSQNYSFDITGHSHEDMGWTENSFTFIADSSLTTLAFDSLKDDSYGAALDNIRVTEDTPSPAPEPSSMVLGIMSLLGLPVFKRKK